MATPIRVLVCDDHSIVREGLRAVLEDGEFTVVGEAADGSEVLAAARRCQPDVILMDLQMPELGGIEAAKLVSAELPGVKILALTTFVDEKLVVECLRVGVHGYVIKDVDKTELKRHIRAVYRGEAIIDPKVTGVLMARVRTGTGAGPDRSDIPLSPQQLTILRFVAQGLSNREIAEQMSLSENTVKGHVAEVLHRLNVKNRVEAAILASERAWL
ncbi:MAG TPA: response regulator transcription factor [Symbiobacteriaceae bacterium]|jgi:DNA-binding NarL/FixJ family response regulator|nr:response regulator transcription factor [Symbiobacteriaceae bacterium]